MQATKLTEKAQEQTNNSFVTLLTFKRQNKMSESCQIVENYQNDPECNFCFVPLEKLTRYKFDKKVIKWSVKFQFTPKGSNCSDTS